MRVKPTVEGAIIRDPVTRLPLPAAGGEVPENSFWIRRLRAGEVVRLEDEKTPTGMEPVTPLTTREEQ